MGIRGELYSSKFASEGRTYFFNIKQNRMGDVFLSIVESKPTEGEMFDRRAIVVFGDQMGGFLDAFRDALKHMDKIGNKVDPLDISAPDEPAEPRPTRTFKPGGARGKPESGYAKREGGFKPREGSFKPREGGFKPREGSYKPREGSFKPREGGFKPREGSFKPGEGGFKPREGSFKPREGGFKPRAGAPGRERHGPAPRRDDRGAPPSGGKRIIVRRKKDSGGDQ